MEEDDWEVIVVMSPEQPAITLSLHLQTGFNKMVQVTTLAGLHELFRYLGGYMHDPDNLWVVSNL